MKYVVKILQISQNMLLILIIDFDNKIVASKLNWCNYNLESLEERQTYLEFIKDYANF